MELLATAVALLVAVEIPFDESAVNPCAFPPLPEKLSVGMLVVASFCITMDTAVSLVLAVTSPVGVKVLAPPQTCWRCRRHQRVLRVYVPVRDDLCSESSTGIRRRGHRNAGLAAVELVANLKTRVITRRSCSAGLGESSRKDRRGFLVGVRRNQEE